MVEYTLYDKYWSKFETSISKFKIFLKIYEIRLWDSTIIIFPFNICGNWGMFDLPKYIKLVMAKAR